MIKKLIRWLLPRKHEEPVWLLILLICVHFLFFHTETLEFMVTKNAPNQPLKVNITYAYDKLRHGNSGSARVVFNFV